MSNDKKNLISSEHRATGLQSLGENINPLIKKLLGGKGLVQIELLAEWKNIVGEETAAYTILQKIDLKKDSRSDGIAHIAVSNGAFALEVSQQKNSIIERINVYFGYHAVADIRVIINDSFFRLDDRPLKDDDKPEKSLVTSTQQNYIDQLTDGVQNAELKSCLKQLGESILKNNQQ